MIYPLVMTNSLLLKMAIDRVKIVSFPMKNGGSFHGYVIFPQLCKRLPEGNPWTNNHHFDLKVDQVYFIIFSCLGSVL